MSATKWTLSQLPDLSGKTALVTGGASGIGFQVARALARSGARVVVLGRDAQRGQEAIDAIRREHGAAHVDFMSVDLGSLASIERFASTWLATDAPVHLLMNVAGVMAVPEREATEDGFEMHMGTNFLGHFALTLRLLPALRAGQARVVSVSALVGRWKMARLDPDDLQGAKARYRPMEAYARSKLAMIMFAVELQRRASAAGVTSVAVDPGTAVTNLQRHSDGVSGAIARALSRAIGYPLARIAENPLYAAVMDAPTDQTLIGPTCVVQRCASPSDVGIPPLARDAATREALWRTAEALTGCAELLRVGDDRHHVR